MAQSQKVKTKWICQQCGFESLRYLGKCPDCSSWGSLIEQQYIKESKNQTQQKKLKSTLNDSKPYNINDIQIDTTLSISTGLSEFDRVLGQNGLVKGSLVLIAGDPGIGKSTLLLQSANNLSKNHTVLYVSAEESNSQIKLRAQRLNVKSDKLFIWSQNDFETIKQHLDDTKPDILIIDSIQALYKQGFSSSSGSVSQIRECTNDLLEIAKNQNITVIIVGHVTKEGNIAGPKVLEHMVDTVIYFEGDKWKTHRLLRCMKNRFGNTNEIGIFNMTSSGLKEVNNPSEFFIHEHQNCSGNVIIATNEGSRPVLVEVQSLVGKSFYPSPRRVANGVDYNRLLQIIAVLEKRIGINLSNQDVYLNTVGGIDVNEPAADLGLALAIITCTKDVCVQPNTVIVGEIGLSGEIRNVTNIDRRINEAQKLGFDKIIIPFQNKPLELSFDINIIQVKKLIEAISICIKKT